MSTQEDYQGSTRADQGLYSATQTNESTAHARDADERHQKDMQKIQDVLVVWLDGSVNENSIDDQINIGNLRDAVNTVKIFGDNDECVDFLEDVANDTVCMIMSESLGQQIVPLVHDMLQINSIFIFCKNENTHEEWTKNWRKIKGAHNEFKSICAKLKPIAQQYERNAISMSIIGADDGLTETSRNRLDPSFMYTQIMKEIFLTITFEKKHIGEWIEYCKEALDGNEKQLKYANELSKEYDQHTPIWWYTRETFLYSKLNGALRTMNVDAIIKFGFFIADLDREIREMHSKQFASPHINQSITVFRGQGMYIKDFEKMIVNEGGLLSFNNFLSTSEDRNFCLPIAESSAQNCNLFGVLFVMKIDPTRPSAHFAYVAEKGYSEDKEKELLFSTHAVFRIGKNSVIDLDNPRLQQVELTLASDVDNDLLPLVNYIRQETFPGDPGWYRLGQVLRKMGEAVKAQQIYEILLEETSEDNNRALIYHQLGMMKYDQEKHKQAIAFYEKSIEIEIEQDSPRLKNLCMSLNNMGCVYLTTGEYKEAISFHEKALEIQKKLLPPNHPHLALSYLGIGTAHNKMKQYETALQFYKSALEIQKQALPPAHPHLAALYNNIGGIYAATFEYKQAHEFYERALKIQKQSLPPTHSALAASYDNIGSIYASQEEYDQALEFYKKALAIYEQLPDLDRLGLASSYNNLGVMYGNVDQCNEALKYLKKSLTIREKLLSPTHPSLAESYNNIGVTYKKKEEYSTALSFYQKALTIQTQLPPSARYDMASSYNNIANMYRCIRNYSKAFSFYEKTMAIEQQASFRDDHGVACTYVDMGQIHVSKHNCWKAHLYWQYAVYLEQRVSSPSRSHLQQWKYHLWYIRKQIR